MKNEKQITHEGVLELGDFKIPCYVLEDGTRVISSRGMQNALMMESPEGKSEEQKSGTLLSRFVVSKWFKQLIDNDKELEHFQPVVAYKGNQKINGYEASALVDFCNIMLQARKEGKVTTTRRVIIAEQSEIIIRSFAKVGIIALIDEATGYQEVREKDALKQFLEKFLLEEKTKWVRTFPDDFFDAIFKMKGISWKQANKGKKPQWMGHHINDLVYSRLGPEVLYSLRKLNPKTAKGYRPAKHPQYMSDEYGKPKLKEHLNILVAFAKAAGYNWNNFRRMVERALPQFSQDGSRLQELPFAEDLDFEEITDSKKEA
jgi:hypothetical protein